MSDPLETCPQEVLHDKFCRIGQTVGALLRRSPLPEKFDPSRRDSRGHQGHCNRHRLISYR